MNIKEASIQIKNAMKVYFMKDDEGNYILPPEKQRPVFLVGAPGIGKTAIIEQIAKDLDVGVLSYSMTHHTRQSALGLPYITTKNFGGKDYQVSEYTMSEIIASVYDYIEQTGKKEGILFLDEINCVSETLTPAMLQFLQYKTFGTHRVPAGWIVVTAGNPPEFNKSAKEFDIATLDRLKKIDVEPNYAVWREYALKNGVHGAVISFLDSRSGDFYRIESTASGKNYVTARGWEDLSVIINLYEKAGIQVDETLVLQYIHNRKIASDFTDTYLLYSKYSRFYASDDFLSGNISPDDIDAVKNLKPAEKLCVVNIILETVKSKTNKAMMHYTDIQAVIETVKELKTAEAIEDFAKNQGTAQMQKFAEALKKSPLQDVIRQAGEGTRKTVADASALLKNAVDFVTSAFGSSREPVLFLSGLTEDRLTSKFIRTFGCEEYSKAVSICDFEARHTEILSQI